MKSFGCAIAFTLVIFLHFNSVGGQIWIEGLKDNLGMFDPESKLSGPCLDLCNTDKDCPQPLRCYQKGCGHICMTPEQQESWSDLNMRNGLPGHCSDTCTTDDDCPDNMNCLMNGCGLMCVEADPKNDLWDWDYKLNSTDHDLCLNFCSTDNECPQSMVCSKMGCSHICVPTFTDFRFAPTLTDTCGSNCILGLDALMPCINLCSDDDDCAENMKCTIKGCGRVCMVPEEEDTGLWDLESSLNSDQWDSCSDLCTTDADCLDNMRCMMEGCRQQCMPSYLGFSEEPAVCGMGCSLDVEMLMPCVNLCYDDNDCPHNMMCSIMGCGRMCIESHEEEYPLCGSTCLLGLDALMPCINLCSSDDDCPTSKTCTIKGCGRLCMDPQDALLDPWDLDSSMGSLDSCYTDEQCPDDMKCVLQEGGLQCVESYEELSVCGSGCFLGLDALMPCINLCHTDDDCPDSQICSIQGCGRLCLAPDDEEFDQSYLDNLLNLDSSELCTDMCSSDDHCPEDMKCIYKGCGRLCALTYLDPLDLKFDEGEIPDLYDFPYKDIDTGDLFKFSCKGKGGCLTSEILQRLAELQEELEGSGASSRSDLDFDLEEGSGESSRNIMASSTFDEGSGLRSFDFEDLQQFEVSEHGKSAKKSSTFLDKVWELGAHYKSRGLKFIGKLLGSDFGSDSEDPWDQGADLNTLTSDPCTDECNDNDDCPEHLECAKVGCARVCTFSYKDQFELWDTDADVRGLPEDPCADKCTTDTDCPKKQKCSNLGCGRVCVASATGKFWKWESEQLEPLDPCTDKCFDNNDCPENQKCVKSECGLICAATDNLELWDLDVRSDGLPYDQCVDQCNGDDDCPGNQQCTKVGCGHLCVASNKEKSGLCPPADWGRDLSQCVHTCVNDNDCPGEKKCCTKQCGLTCVMPFKAPEVKKLYQVVKKRKFPLSHSYSWAKAGLCPKPSGVGTCVNHCSTDNDCPDAKKCCSNGCGLVCVEP